MENQNIMLIYILLLLLIIDINPVKTEEPKINSTQNLLKMQKFCGTDLSNTMSFVCLTYPKHKRRRREVVKECCTKPCSLMHIIKHYCGTSIFDAQLPQLLSSKTSPSPLHLPQQQTTTQLPLPSGLPTTWPFAKNQHRIQSTLLPTLQTTKTEHDANQSHEVDTSKQESKQLPITNQITKDSSIEPTQYPPTRLGFYTPKNRVIIYSHSNSIRKGHVDYNNISTPI